MRKRRDPDYSARRSRQRLIISQHCRGSDCCSDRYRGAYSGQQPVSVGDSYRRNYHRTANSLPDRDPLLNLRFRISEYPPGSAPQSVGEPSLNDVRLYEAGIKGGAAPASLPH